MPLLRGLASTAFVAVVFAGAMALPSCEKATATPTPPPVAAQHASVPDPEHAAAAAEALERFLAAAQAGDGAAAAALVHPDYFDLVRQHIDAALDARREVVKAMPLRDRVRVLSLRVQLEPAALRTITPEAYTAMSIERGWVSTAQMVGAGVELVELHWEDAEDPRRASALLRRGETTLTPPVAMAVHEGRWLVDLAALLEATRESYEAAPARLGVDEDTFVRAAVSQFLAEPLPEDLYEPVGRE